MLMAMKPDGEPEGLEGVRTSDPSFGLPVVWIPRAQKDVAEMKGCTTVGSASVFITHLAEILARHAHEILNREDVKLLVDNVKAQNPTVVEELIPDMLTLGHVQQVLARLLEEQIPIGNLAYILERLGHVAPRTKDPALLTELVRKALAEALEKSDDGQVRLSLPPARLRQILDGISDQVRRSFAVSGPVVVATDPALRPTVRGLVRRVSRDIPVISYDEILDDVPVENVGLIAAQDRPLPVGETAAA